jgi:hypothetical protein
MALVVIGLAIGLALTRLLAGQLYGVSATSDRDIRSADASHAVESGVDDRAASDVIEPRVEILCSPFHLAFASRMGKRHAQQFVLSCFS